MNIFSTDEFLETMGAVYFPKRRRAIERRSLDGRVLKVLVLDGKEVVRQAPYYDFPQPLEATPFDSLEPLAYFPRTVLHTVPVAQRTKEPAGCQPSPYIDWSLFSHFEDFEQHAENHGARFADSRRQRRRLEKELGPLKFVLDDPRPEVFDACIKWKGAQYASSGFKNLFAEPQCIELFRQLRRRGVIAVSSLFAKDTLLAAHIGALHDGRLAWWVPAYDVAFEKFSVGRLLLEDAMRASHSLGHAEFDFLLGDEKYKFLYATHVRVVGPLGTAPFFERAMKNARVFAKRAVADHPRLKALSYGLRDRTAKLMAFAEATSSARRP